MAHAEGNGATTTNGEAESDGDDFKESEIIRGKSGRVTGIIYPPPDIRAIVDKTANWVAKYGKDFETRLLDSGEGKTSKFNFMKREDPYNAYYEYKIRQFEEEPAEKRAKTENELASTTGPATGLPTPAPVATAPPTTAATTVKKATILGAIARAALNKPKEDPAPYEFFMHHPEGLSAHDVEVIKLTAQYTAASGRQFLANLAMREQRNPQFDFLKPTHMLFSYFTSLVDAYTKVLQPSAQQRRRAVDGLDKHKVLQRTVHRWEFDRQEEERKRQAQAEADAERVAYQALDWHEFTIVETITFGDDELMDVPLAGTEAADKEDVDMDMSDNEDEAIRAPPPPPTRVYMPPPPPVVDDDAEQIRVVMDYQPVVHKGQALPNVMIDPVSGREVRLDEMPEHMRIQFMDPRWREEQKRAMDKKQESALAEGGDIAANLRRFTQKRTDIFGTVEDQERQILEDRDRRRQREEEVNRITWDGHSSSVATVQAKTMERMVEQIQRGAQTYEPQAAPRPATSYPPPPPPMAYQPPVAVPPPPPPVPLPTAVPYQYPPPPQGMGNEVDEEPQQPTLLSEAEFAATVTGPLVLHVQAPVDESNPQWGLSGQLVSIKAAVMSSVKEVKEQLSALHGGMPVNKMQLKSPTQGFLKDNQSLASYNLGNNSTFELLVRTRARR